MSLFENRGAKTGLFFVALIAATVVWLYLTGGLFLEFTDTDSFGAATPLTAYEYWFHYGEDSYVKMWLRISAGISGVCVLVPLLFFIKPRRRSLHGDARWATMSDIAKAKLLGKSGVLVGRKSGKYLCYEGDSHVLMAAPNRSGKGVGVVVPNLLNWAHSVVVLDVKQENWVLTAGFRAAHGQSCYLFNPTAKDYRTHRWNPLNYVSDDPKFAINDIQKIAHKLFPDVENDAPIWQSSARSLFLGLVLYLRESNLPVTLGEVLRQATLGGDTRFKDVIEERDQSGRPLSDQCVAALNDYLNTADNTRTSIRKTFTSALELWFNPVIDAATSANDFDFRDLRKKRISLYVGVTPDDLGRLRPLLNLFFEQLVDANIQELPDHNPELKYKCLLLMDEFAALGHMDTIMRAIGFIAGYGLRMLTILQSPSQIRDLAGENAADNFFTNHGVQIVFAPKEIRVAEDISKTLGTTTVKAKTKTRQLGIRFNRSTNESHQRRELLMPQEVREIGAQNEIILAENCRPIKAQKIVYYKDSALKKRVMDPPSLTPISIPESSSDEHSSAAENVAGGLKVEGTPHFEDKSVHQQTVDPTEEATASNADDEERKRIVSSFLDNVEPSS